MIDMWKKSEEDYKIARYCLCCPKHSNNWHRDEDKGMYHLWNAYYAAIQAETKEHLLYARILMLMANQQHIDDYTCFRKYIAPAKEAYEKAIESEGNKPAEKELKEVNWLYESLEYKLKKTEDTEEAYIDACKLIEGLTSIKDFYFHDSKPIYFEHTEKNAKLKLDLNGKVVLLIFEELIDIEINGDPLCNWINDFYCYKEFYYDTTLRFDIGHYKITCKKIKALQL